MSFRSYFSLSIQYIRHTVYFEIDKNKQFMITLFIFYNNNFIRTVSLILAINLEQLRRMSLKFEKEKFKKIKEKEKKSQ